MKIMYIQYAGDFSEAYERLILSKGSENYYGQKYSVQAVLNQARKGNIVLVLTTISKKYIKILENRLIAEGIKSTSHFRYFFIFLSILRFKPEKVILRMPDWRILFFLRLLNISVFPVFADSFNIPKGFREKFGRKLLSSELKKRCIKWIANHQLNSSKSLFNIGCNPKNILPYDWEHKYSPSDFSPSIHPNLVNKKITLFYAGSISKSKGIFDLIGSLKCIKENGRIAELRIAGLGEIKEAKVYAKSINVFSDIKFLGLIDHDSVLKEMNLADVVVVPSHHSYPEGFPMTIMESLLVQTPVVVSDHPMFKGRLSEGRSVEFFTEKNINDIAKKVILICSDLDFYHVRCESASTQWSKLNLNLKWADMIDKWLENSNDSFFNENSLMQQFLK